MYIIEKSVLIDTHADMNSGKSREENAVQAAKKLTRFLSKHHFLRLKQIFQRFILNSIINN